MFAVQQAQAQLKARVVDASNKQVLAGANVYGMQSKTGAIADATGFFTWTNTDDNSLIISYTGYKKDTVNIEGKNLLIIELTPNQMLKTVTISSKVDAVSTLKTKQVEQITSGEIRKNACCNLSESFQINC